MTPGRVTNPLAISWDSSTEPASMVTTTLYSTTSWTSTPGSFASYSATRAVAWGCVSTKRLEITMASFLYAWQVLQAIRAGSTTWLAQSPST